MDVYRTRDKENYVHLHTDEISYLCRDKFKYYERYANSFMRKLAFHILSSKICNLYDTLEKSGLPQYNYLKKEELVIGRSNNNRGDKLLVTLKINADDENPCFLDISSIGGEESTLINVQLLNCNKSNRVKWSPSKKQKIKPMSVEDEAIYHIMKMNRHGNAQLTNVRCDINIKTADQFLSSGVLSLINKILMCNGLTKKEAIDIRDNFLEELKNNILPFGNESKANEKSLIKSIKGSLEKDGINVVIEKTHDLNKKDIYNVKSETEEVKLIFEYDTDQYSDKGSNVTVTSSKNIHSKVDLDRISKIIYNETVAHEQKLKQKEKEKIKSRGIDI